MNISEDKYGTKKKQQELLSIIKDINKIFEGHGIEYSLCGGSLIGAVRENGFIPWDDDIDIMVDRKNYEKILTEFNSYRTRYYIDKSFWVYRIARKRKKGEEKDTNQTHIDIFVMDNCPNSIVVRKIKVLLIKLLQGMIKKDINYKDFSVIYKICLFVTHLIGLPFSNKFKLKLYDKVCQIGNKKKSMYLTGYTDAFGLLNLKYTGKLFDRIEIHTFEDTVLPITSEYDNYLRTQYGDYMKRPEESERVSLHI